MSVKYSPRLIIRSRQPAISGMIDAMQQRHYPYNFNWSRLFPGSWMLLGFEGGALYAAEQEGRYYLITDQGSLADLLDPIEDADVLERMVTVMEFDTLQERLAYVQQRWDAARAGSISDEIWRRLEQGD